MNPKKLAMIYPDRTAGWLEEQRKILRLTKSGMARMLDISPQRYHHLATGRNRPSLEIIQALVRRGCKVKELFA